MRRSAALFCMLLISVMLWSGTAVRAAELVGCVEASAEGPGHFDSDRGNDQAPSDSDKSTPHHHGACHANSAAVASDGDAPAWAPGSTLSVGLRPSEFLSGCDPGTALRPPIA